MELKCVLITLICLFVNPSLNGAHLTKKSDDRLNEYISHYETLNYDNIEPLDTKPNRAKRSTMKNGDQNVQFNFTAFGESFHLRLKQDTSTFSDKLEIVHFTNGTESNDQLDLRHIYRGNVVGDIGSYVHGSIVDGKFFGRIVTSQDSYNVENARNYFIIIPHRTRKQDFHSVIYKDQHVLDLERIKKLPDEEESVALFDNSNDTMNVLKKQNYTRYDNQPDHSEASSERETNTCSLFIRTDPFLWRHIRASIRVRNYVERSIIIDEQTKLEILSLIADHVDAVNRIFNDTKFEGKFEERKIRFEVKKIQIDDDAKCDPDYRGEANPFCEKYQNESDFLDLHSSRDHEEFCLAYVFTFRNFGKVKGGAYRAVPMNDLVGVCSEYHYFEERSLNTGFVTFEDLFGLRRFPPLLSQLVFAHEIGHSFGADHDPVECQPGVPEGNFLMFDSVQRTFSLNRGKFSSCSIREISQILEEIADYERRNCFESDLSPIRIFFRRAFHAIINFFTFGNLVILVCVSVLVYLVILFILKKMISAATNGFMLH